MENLKVKASKELQAEIEAVAGDMTRGEIGELIEQIKAPRKIVNDFVVKHAELVKCLGSAEVEEALNQCGSLVTDQRTDLAAQAQQLLSGLEHWRWLVDERIAILRRQEALAKDKYGNERKPLELTPEEQELAYDLRGAAMRDAFEQTQAIQRELKVTKMLQRARQEVMDLSSQPISTMSRSSLNKLVNHYKRLSNTAIQRAEEAEGKLANGPFTPTIMPETPRKPGDNRPRTTNHSCPSIIVGPADIRQLQEKLTAANREIDYLRKRVVTAERQAGIVRSKMAGSENVMERLAKIANKERLRSAQLDRELTRYTETGLAYYGISHRTLPQPPELLPTTYGDVIARK